MSVLVDWFSLLILSIVAPCVQNKAENSWNCGQHSTPKSCLCMCAFVYVHIQQLQLMMLCLLSVFEADRARQQMEKKTEFTQSSEFLRHIFSLRVSNAALMLTVFPLWVNHLINILKSTDFSIVEML